MFTYHSGALVGSPAYAATTWRGRSITISLTTSTGIAPVVPQEQTWNSPSGNVVPFTIASTRCAPGKCVRVVRLANDTFASSVVRARGASDSAFILNTLGR